MLAKFRIPLLALLALFIFASVASAATSRVELNDGTVLVGEVKKLGSSYSIKLADGSVKLISSKNIKAIDGKPLQDAPTGGAGAGGADKPAAGAGDAKSGSAAFAGTKSKADRVTTPIAAVVLWEKFIELFPNSPDIEAAKAELALWQKRDAEKAEKVKGQWIGGKELEALKKEIDKLVGEGLEAEQEKQFNVAQKKYESAIAKYPTHFIANFRLGYFSLVNSNGRPDRLDAAIKHLEVARTVDASGPEVWANLACAYSLRRRYVESIMAADKALKIFTDPELVAQLVAAVSSAPRSIYNNNPKIREIIDNNGMNLAGVGADGGDRWKYFYPGYFDAKRRGSGKGPIQGDDKSRVGILGNGSGFFITADGYAITNKHVVTDEDMKPDPTVVFRVRLDDGKEYPARVVAMDDKFDIALIKVDPPKGAKFPFLLIAEDNANAAAQALVLGYPATFDGRYSMQVTAGDVKSIQIGDEYEVWLNLSTTQGNSGGPIIDRAGRVIGILSAVARSQNNNFTAVNYVLGIGPNQIEQFLGRIADKAPKITYEGTPSDSISFNAERLAGEHRKATLLILAVRPEAGKVQDGDKPGEGKPGDDKADPKSDDAKPDGAKPDGDATPSPAP